MSKGERLEQKSLYDVFEKWFNSRELSFYIIARTLKRGIATEKTVFRANLRSWEIVSASLHKQPNAYELVVMTRYNATISIIADKNGEISISAVGF